MSNDQYGPNEQKINDICSSIASGMASLENDRLLVRKRIRLSWLVVVLLLAAAIGSAFIFSLTATLIVSGVAFVLFLIFYFVYVNPPLSRFNEAFRSDVIRGIITGLLPGAVYDHNMRISESDYVRSCLFTTGYDRYSGSDLVSGVLGKTSVEFSRLHTEYKEVTQTKNGTRTTWHTIFKGIFMIADANKNFSGHTFILPDTGEQFFGGLGKWFQRNMGGNGRGKMVYMENPDFEKRFVVYATDPVEARYLITPQMQERALYLREHSRGDVCMSFVGGKLYIALNGGGEMFNPVMSMPLTDTNTIRYYSRGIVDILAIVDILDLNTRIWGRS